MTNAHHLYWAAMNADVAYAEELQKEYGSNAVDARYDALKNEATPELAVAAQLCRETFDAWKASPSALTEPPMVIDLMDALRRSLENMPKHNSDRGATR